MAKCGGKNQRPLLGRWFEVLLIETSTLRARLPLVWRHFPLTNGLQAALPGSAASSYLFVGALNTLITVRYLISVQQ
ncbi:hypothetical protein C9I57_07570 [Trinickia symbiotica]|uniref:Uncharacterized protein n=1 Tax=Trinickia symbiotica TaxID=863227 RepID=A0A2T3XYB1_9BURK|nr:hypothetical protein C9I57_07570 [Trinickia symbiotica]